MEILSILGQYLLLSFVLPGFCYFGVLYVCFPTARESLKTYWVAVSFIGGLLISSLAFGAELLLRNIVSIDCYWFPRIPFDKIHDLTSAGSFFAAETFMHLNIGLGLLVILVVFAVHPTGARDKHGHTAELVSRCSKLAVLAIIAAANMIVASYLFSRVNDIAYNMQDAVLKGSEQACECLPSHPSHGGLTQAQCDKLIWPPVHSSS